MYKVLCCLVVSGLLLTLVNLSAQNITIDRSVIGSGGMVNAVNSDNITMSGLTGQTAIEILTGIPMNISITRMAKPMSPTNTGSIFTSIMIYLSLICLHKVHNYIGKCRQTIYTKTDT